MAGADLSMIEAEKINFKKRVQIVVKNVVHILRLWCHIIRMKLHSLLRLEVGMAPKMLAAATATLINALILKIISKSQRGTLNYCILLCLCHKNNPQGNLWFDDDVLSDLDRRV